MYCPKCRVEYRAGFSTCSDCGEGLVDVLPPEPEIDYAELVTVYTAIDENMANLALSLLKDVGIDAYLRDESGADVFGAVAPGFPVEVQVMPDDEDAALEILEDLEEEYEDEEEGEDEGDEEDEEYADEEEEEEDTKK